MARCPPLELQDPPLYVSLSSAAAWKYELILSLSSTDHGEEATKALKAKLGEHYHSSTENIWVSLWKTYRTCRVSHPFPSRFNISSRLTHFLYSTLMTKEMSSSTVTPLDVPDAEPLSRPPPATLESTSNKKRERLDFSCCFVSTITPPVISFIDIHSSLSLSHTSFPPIPRTPFSIFLVCNNSGRFILPLVLFFYFCNDYAFNHAS